MRMLGPVDPTVAWDGRGLYLDADVDAGVTPPPRLLGPAAGVQRAARGRSPAEGAWRVFRDRLGLGKLFWARDRGGTVTMAARPARLVAAGCAFEEIHAFPRGRTWLAGTGRPAEPAGAASPGAHAPAGDAGAGDAGAVLDDAGAVVRATLERYLAAAAAAFAGRPAFACLSGGLDSSTVALLAREHFAGMVAVSFDLRRGGRPSDDRRAAERLARDLAVPLMTVDVTAGELLDHLDEALVEGVDWRDFNVHAALVNAALAEAIGDAGGSQDGGAPVVLTGDLSNELLADYEPERYGDRDYYRLPRLPAAALRDALVDGLDSCHREVGIFGARGLPVLQPYVAALEDYLALPGAALARADRKARLLGAVAGGRLPAYVSARPKVRAQVGGGAGGGVLAACVDRGLDGPELRRRFATLHGLRDDRGLGRFIRAGRYRASVPAPGERDEP